MVCLTMRSDGDSSFMWNICMNLLELRPRRTRDLVWVDKATLTKTIRKLTKVGYIRVTGDEKDRRVKHLYLTEKAIPAAKQIKKIHADFYQTFREGISSEALALTEETLQKMTDNINQKVWHRMEVHHGE